MRQYGPGKFNTIVDSLIYEMSLDGCDTKGDVTEHTRVYVKINGPFDLTNFELTNEEKEYLSDKIGAILMEDDQGFVDVEYYTDQKDFETWWNQIDI